MERKTLAWAVIGVSVGLFALSFVNEIPSWLRVALPVIASILIVYAVLLLIVPDRPTSVEISAELVTAGHWRNNATTGFQVELTVTLDWDRPLQLRFTIELPDGSLIDNEEYHRAYVAGEVPAGFLDNPKKLDPGQTGPFKIAFVVPASIVDPQHAPTSGLMLSYQSVLPRLARGILPLPASRRR